MISLLKIRQNVWGGCILRWANIKTDKEVWQCMYFFTACGYGPLLWWFICFNWRLITLQYCTGFCHTFSWISHGCRCAPHPEPHSHLLPHTIPQGCPSALALSALSHAWNLDWQPISHMVIYMFQCYSLKSFHPCILPQSPKVCSLHLSFAVSHIGSLLLSF